jgi:hypothetical protein
MDIIITCMPRKGSVLTNVVSPKLGKDDFDFLQKCAKQYYDKGYITEPTISHALRIVVQADRKALD